MSFQMMLARPLKVWLLHLETLWLQQLETKVNDPVVFFPIDYIPLSSFLPHLHTIPTPPTPHHSCHLSTPPHSCHLSTPHLCTPPTPHLCNPPTSPSHTTPLHSSHLSLPSISPCKPLGLIRLWSVASGQVLKTLEPLAGHAPSSPAGQAEDKASHTYVSLQYRPTIGGLVGVTYDHNILFYTGEDLKRTKQVVRGWGHGSHDPG